MQFLLFFIASGFFGFIKVESLRVFPDFLTASTSITTSESLTIPSTEATVTPSSNDSNFDWFGAFIVLFVTCAAIAIFVIRRKCTPSGTYNISKANHIPKEYYVKYCNIDDDLIDIHARALYVPPCIISIENQYFEESQIHETCV